MTPSGWLQIALYFFLLVALVKPLGAYMARVYDGQPTLLARVVGPVERLLYRLYGIHPNDEMDWRTYAVALLLFSATGMLFLYGLQRLQHVLPLNPRQFAAVPAALAFNTAASFTTNTNWQNYSGETTLSYLTGMLGPTVSNFVSAAAGMAILMAFIRGFSRRSAHTLGNFWVDLTRGVLYILLPIAFVLALILVSQGVVQSLGDYRTVPLLQPITYSRPEVGADGNPIKDANGQLVTETVTVTEQVLAVAPASSQVAIKHLGTNGGGVFNTNAAHPFENPTPLSDLLVTLAETSIAAALTYTFGKMVGDTRQGWAILAAMLIVLVAAVAFDYAAESAGNSQLTALGVDQTTSAVQSGGNMEGKEIRFGIARSALFATLTTATSSGAVNSMHDSFTPLGGLTPMVMMQTGEAILGGVGSGLYGMLVLAIIAVFIAGLMVGRTPEYLGKKIEAYEMKMASILILIMPMIVLIVTAVAVVSAAGQAGIANPGPHGFSEILYAFTSMTNNNGSAFAGVNGNTPFYNLVGAFVMLFGRFWLAIPTLALAGSLARKTKVPVSAGTLPTHTPLFVVWLVAVVLIVAALVFFPALSLGPIVEHLMLAGS